jgi:hypothetical protein
MRVKDVAATLGVSRHLALRLMERAGVPAERLSNGRVYRYAPVTRERMGLVLAAWASSEQGMRRFAKLAARSLRSGHAASSDDVDKDDVRQPDAVPSGLPEASK